MRNFRTNQNVWKFEAKGLKLRLKIKPTVTSKYLFSILYFLILFLTKLARYCSLDKQSKKTLFSTYWIVGLQIPKLIIALNQTQTTLNETVHTTDHCI